MSRSLSMNWMEIIRNLVHKYVAIEHPTAAKDDLLALIFDSSGKLYHEYEERFGRVSRKNMQTFATALFYVAWNNAVEEKNILFEADFFRRECASIRGEFPCDRKFIDELLVALYQIDQTLYPPKVMRRDPLPPIFLEERKIIPTTKGWITNKAFEEIVFPLRETLCGYALGKELGSGTFGQVREAHDLSDRRDNGEEKTYAIKFQNDDSWKKIVNEAAIQVQLGGGLGGGLDVKSRSQSLRQPYPNIALVTKFLPKCKPGTFMTVMPRAATTLRKILTSQLFNIDYNGEYQRNGAVKALRIKLAADIVCGLYGMHSAEFAHYDLKPENILVSSSKTPGASGDALTVTASIADFGLAQHFMSEHLGFVAPSVVTSWYRAPEISCGLHHYGPAADVWSLGVMLAEIFFNLQPFRENDNYRHIQEIFYNIQPDRSFVDSLKDSVAYDQMYAKQCRGIAAATMAAAREGKEKKTSGTRDARSIRSIRNMLSPEERDYYENIYYTPEQYRDIWAVIDGALQVDFRKRITMREIISSPFFASILKCNLPKKQPSSGIEKVSGRKKYLLPIDKEPSYVIERAQILERRLRLLLDQLPTYDRVIADYALYSLASDMYNHQPFDDLQEQINLNKKAIDKFKRQFEEALDFDLWDNSPYPTSSTSSTPFLTPSSVLYSPSRDYPSPSPPAGEVQDTEFKFPTAPPPSIEKFFAELEHSRDVTPLPIRIIPPPTTSTLIPELTSLPTRSTKRRRTSYSD